MKDLKSSLNLFFAYVQRRHYPKDIASRSGKQKACVKTCNLQCNRITFHLNTCHQAQAPYVLYNREVPALYR